MDFTSRVGKEERSLQNPIPAGGCGMQAAAARQSAQAPRNIPGSPLLTSDIVTKGEQTHCRGKRADFFDGVYMINLVIISNYITAAAQQGVSRMWGVAGGCRAAGVWGARLAAFSRMARQVSVGSAAVVAQQRRGVRTLEEVWN